MSEVAGRQARVRRGQGQPSYKVIKSLEEWVEGGVGGGREWGGGYNWFENMYTMAAWFRGGEERGEEERRGFNKYSGKGE